MQAPVHEALKPISWLAGKWTTTNGKGHYPNIPDFQYHEELEFICIVNNMKRNLPRLCNESPSNDLSPLMQGFLQKICYKKAASIDMTQHGFISDSKAIPVNLLLKPLKTRLEEICGPSQIKEKHAKKKVVKVSVTKRAIIPKPKPDIQRVIGQPVVRNTKVSFKIQ